MPSEFNDDFLAFDDFKDRFRVLERNLHDIHEQWEKLHSGASSESQQMEGLTKHEFEILEELRELLHSTQRVMFRNLQRLNTSS